MYSKLIYKLTKILVYDYVEGSDKNQINCYSIGYGFFDNPLNVIYFIHKHNKDKNCFFICRSYVFNPIHSAQCEDYVFETTYDYKGDVMCDCPTNHFVVNYHELVDNEAIKFKGRTHPIAKKDDIAWYYDCCEEILQKCKIGEPPFNKTKAKKYEQLDWYDDSYLVYPLPIQEYDNHQHIISCYMFSDKMIKNMTNF